MILNKFFRWLYNPNEPDSRKRITPPCMMGIRKLPRQEKSPYKPSNLWDATKHSIFLISSNNFDQQRIYHNKYFLGFYILITFYNIGKITINFILETKQMK
jgi:hypothetical protein